jgi:hypothetical protein
MQSGESRIGLTARFGGMRAARCCGMPKGTALAVPDQKVSTTTPHLSRFT